MPQVILYTVFKLLANNQKSHQIQASTTSGSIADPTAKRMNTVVYSFVISWGSRPLVLMRREEINTAFNSTPSYGSCQD